MKNIIILTDTRQQKDSHIIKIFDKENILHIRTGLSSADYMAVRYDEKTGFYFDYKTLIDTKKDMEEIAHNLCNTTEHERIKRELERAKKLGCENFVFLIANENIKTEDDIKNWSSTRTRVKGETLLKVMRTMKEKYGCRFIITSKKQLGYKIIQLLC